MTDARVSAVTGQLGNIVKTAKQSSQQGKQLAREASRDTRVAGMKGEEAPTTARSNRVAKANTSARKV